MEAGQGNAAARGRGAGVEGAGRLWYNGNILGPLGRTAGALGRRRKSGEGGKTMPQHVTISDYDPQWPQQYQREKEALAASLGDNCMALYHIGSASVPGLAAKPIIDIMGVVKRLEEVDAIRARFGERGYEYLGEWGIAGRRYLRKGGDQRTHQVHIFQGDDWHNIGRHLAFRDYMRAHEGERRAYAQLKRALAERFPYDIEGYCAGKEEFVKAVEQRALAQYDGAWHRLYLAARGVQGARRLSPWVEAGAVAAALLTRRGNIYTGVCVDTACSLGMCAERNAIANMITHGESRIERLAVVMPNGQEGMPCGACRELMAQMGEGAGSIEILSDYEAQKAVRLEALLPRWWGEARQAAEKNQGECRRP